MTDAMDWRMPSRALWTALGALLLTFLCISLVGHQVGAEVSSPESSTLFQWVFRPPEELPTTDSSEPGNLPREVDIAVDDRGNLYAIWVEHGTSVVSSTRHAGSTGFAEGVVLAIGRVLGAPRIVVGPNGTVHAAWIEERDSDVSGRAVDEETTSYLVWTYSCDGGLSWTVPRTIVIDKELRNPSLATSPAGNIMATAWMAFDGTGQEGDPLERSYKILFLSWAVDTHTVWKCIVSPKVPKASEYQKLLVNDAGNPIVIYVGATEINFNFSLDGGMHWHGPHGFNAVRPIAMDAALLDDHTLAVVWTKRDETSPERYTLCRTWLSFNENGNTASTQGGSPPVHRTAFSIHARDGSALVSLLVSPQSDDGGGWNDSAQPWLRIDRMNTSEGFESSGPLFPIQGWDGNATELQLDACLEGQGQPIIAVTSSKPHDGSSRTMVWRVNHPPCPPDNLSEGSGGWVLNRYARLTIKPVLDIDGDPLEYRFSYGPLGGRDISNSGFLLFISAIAGPLAHGRYWWSVEARDPYNATSRPVQDWWFGLDSQGPRADAGGPYLTVEGSWMNLDGSGSSDDGPISLWEWDIDADGAYDFQTANPLQRWDPTDDYDGPLILRVTDEAGRRAVMTSRLTVLNAPPSVLITGPILIQGHADFTASASDPSPYDGVIVRWALDGVTVGNTSDYHLEPSAPGTYHLSAMAIDDDGGSACAFIMVTVERSGGALFSITAPTEVLEGADFYAGLASPPPGWIAQDEISWRVDGRWIGSGTGVRLSAGAPGYSRLEVGLIERGEFHLEDATVVRVRERLRPVALLGVMVKAYDTVEVRWSLCDQIALFERYIVRISGEPLPYQPDPDLEWMSSASDGPYAPVEILLRGENSIEFRGLDDGWTYYACVYVVGSDEVAPSTTDCASIPLTPGPSVPHASDDALELGLLKFLVVLLFVLSSVCGLYVLVRWNDRDGRQGD